MPPIDMPQLQYLRDASDWLSSRSPSTSAHLLGVHTRMLHDDCKPLNSREQKHHCAGCGSIRQSNCRKVTRVSWDKRRARGTKSSVANAKGKVGGSATIYKCLRCQQRTVLPRQKKTSMPARPAAAPVVAKAPAAPIAPTSTEAIPTSQSSLAANPDPSKSGENANSKKRAKARKQGGLQALLASKQRPEPSLDLFDFLQ